MDDQQKKDRLKSLLVQSASMFGGAMAGAMGAAAGGPAAGFALGAVSTLVSNSFAQIGKEFAERHLGPKEEEKIGATMLMIDQLISERFEAGARIRDDDFFKNTKSGDSKAKNITEDALNKARNEAESKKLKFYAELIASSTVDTSISDVMAHQMIKYLDQMSYRQLLILKSISSPYRERFRASSYADVTEYEQIQIEILFELYELISKQFVANGDVIALSIADIVPNRLKIQGMGAHIFNHAKLKQIPYEEWSPVALVLM
jgi:hypothetical protein